VGVLTSRTRRPVSRMLCRAYFLHHRGTLKMEAVCTSETSVNFYENTRHTKPKYSHTGLDVFCVRSVHFIATGQVGGRGLHGAVPPSPQRVHCAVLNRKENLALYLFSRVSGPLWSRCRLKKNVFSFNGVSVLYFWSFCMVATAAPHNNLIPIFRARGWGGVGGISRRN